MTSPEAEARWTTSALDALKELRAFLVNAYDEPVSYTEVRRAMGPPEDVPEAVAQARAQKALLGLLKALLEANPARNQAFVAQPGWPWLAKLVAVIRLRELASARIVLRGKKGGASYDASELARTYHGRRMLDGLGFGRRRVLSKDELAKLEEACKAVKLTLPTTIEPTTTEKYFGAATGDAEEGD